MRIGGSAALWSAAFLPDYEASVSEVAGHMVDGRLADLLPGEYGIVLGDELAKYLGVFMGEKITLISPQVNSTPAGVVPRMRRFTVVGIFKVGLHDFDRNMALIHLDDAAKLFRTDASVSALRIKLDDLLNAPEITKSLGRYLARLFCQRLDDGERELLPGHQDGKEK